MESQTQERYLQLLQTQKKWLEQEALRFYEPHPKQLEFHKSTAGIRALLAGNQFGKTYAGCMEIAWTVGKCHPYRPNLVGGVRARDCCVSFNTIQSVLIPTYKRILPRGEAKLSGKTFEGKDRWWPGLKGGAWNKAWSDLDKIVHLADGSFIEFKSYEQGREAFQGPAREVIREDEEPKEMIHTENVARQFAVKSGLNIIITMTPLNYSQWIWAKIFEGSAKHDHIEIFTGSSFENPHINPESLARMEADCSDPAERAARLHGQPTYMEGRVWKEYGDHNLIPHFQPPDAWKKTIVIDPHEVKATGVNWYAYDDLKKKHYAYKEAQLTGDVEQICEQIKALSSDERIDLVLMDPSARRAATIRGKGRMIDQFRYFLGAIVEANNNVSYGIDEVRRMVRNRPSGPLFYVMRSCPLTDYQMKNLSYKPPLASGEARSKPEIFKKDDEHADNTRYYFATTPRREDEFEGFGVGVYAN